VRLAFSGHGGRLESRFGVDAFGRGRSDEGFLSLEEGSNRMRGAGEMTAVSSEPDGSSRLRVAPGGMRRRKTRPAPAVGRSWSWRYALVAYLVVLILDFALAFALPRQALRIGIGSLALDAVMLAALIPLYRAQPFAARDLGLRRTAPARAVGLTFAALVAYIVVAVLWVLLILGQDRHQITPQLQTGTVGTVVAGIGLCFTAPVTEEIFFRGLLYRALRNRLAVGWSIAIVAVLFAAAHASTYPADTLPIKAAFAVVTCLLYERTGSLYPGIALHGLVDSTGYEASISHGQAWIAPAAYAAFGLALLLRHRLRAPTVAEVRAFRGHPGLRPVGPSLGGAPDRQSLRRAGPLARAGDALVVRFGYHSARRVLMSTGAVGVLIAFIGLVATGPYAHHQHATRGAVFGLVFILGVLMMISAVIWRIFRRPAAR
jgi:membrane protease YdiL (CAAX protease family)